MTETVLVFEALETWRVLLAIGVVLSAGFSCWRTFRDTLPPLGRYGLLVLRFLGVMCLAGLILHPAIQSRTLIPVQRRLAVVVDASQSMDFPTDKTHTRWETVASFLRQNRDDLEQLANNYHLEYYRLADGLQPTSKKRLLDTPDGNKTDLFKATEQLCAMAKNGDLAAAVLLSDGADTESPGSFSEEAAGRRLTLGLDGCPMPINTISVGDQGAFRDVAMASVAVDDFAFIRNAVEVEVGLTSTGFGEMEVPLVLEQEGQLLASTSIKIKPGKNQRWKLKFVPDRVGKFIFRVSTPVVPGESVTANNARTFVVRIIRDKIRVLHVVGRPSWDERFLRQVLKRNPNIDLVSFFILRTPTDALVVSQSELSLIPFPVAELFSTELSTFDVVIFQNFNHQPYQVTYFLDPLQKYVRAGGAFLMMGGDLSFGSGGYAGTPLEQILPVRLSLGPDLKVQEFRAVLSTEGAKHPILEFCGPTAFAKASPLGSYNQVQGLRPHAQVLLEHPFERSGSKRAPIFAIRDVGRGRSAAILTDGFWRWDFIQAGFVGRQQIYQRLFNNLLRWLIHDPGLQPLSLKALRSHFLPGEPVRLTARLRATAKGAQARFELFDARTKKTIRRTNPKLNEVGNAELDLGSLPQGTYKARLNVRVGERVLGEAEEALVVSGLRMEHSNPLPRPDILAGVAEATSGRFQEIGKGSLASLEIDAEKRYRVESSTTQALLSHVVFLVFLVGLLALEWWLRRRWGFA
jgi:uncharacterized membrane protein